MDKNIFCKKLKTARQEAKLKQADVADFLNLPISAISVMESGDRKVDIFELIEISKLYKKPIEYFIYNEKPKEQRRWYDNNPKISQALNLLSKAPLELQEASAMGVIGFLQDSITDKT